jgi:alpha-L-arabinofuranosidase
VNRERDQSIRTDVQLGGRQTSGRIVTYEVNGATPSTVNSFDQPDAVGVREGRLDVPAGGCFEVTFAPHSVTLLRCQLS